MTIIATISPQHTVVSDVKKEIEEKTRIPKKSAAPCESMRVLKDTRKVEDYNLIDEETMELTSALLGGTKREETRPVSKEREAKRKASEPCFDTSNRKENKSTNEGATQSMKYRTDDFSSLEQSHSSLGMDMTAVKNAIGRMSTTFCYMNEENQKID